MANKTRLSILAHLAATPTCTVSQTAAALGIPPTSASLQLRALNARGLLCARRNGRYVLYEFRPDQRVPQAPALHKALLWTFRHDVDPCHTIFRLATAFTHPRRVAIVAALKRQPLTLGAITQKCAISLPAARRHLKKLADRNLVRKKGDSYEIAQKVHPLVRTILDLAR